MSTKEYSEGELRKRNVSSDSSGLKTTTSTTNDAKTTNPTAPAATTQSTKETLEMIAKHSELVLGIILNGVSIASDLTVAYYPYAETKFAEAQVLWKKLDPYHLDVLFPSIIGLILCFFGGNFLLLIAAVEAYRMTGWDTTYKCMKEIFSELSIVAKKSHEDDNQDNNNDGVVDVKQVRSKDLVHRKLMLFMSTIDPNTFTEALGGLTNGFVAVVATLKLRFCRAIALGSAMGDVVIPPVITVVENLIKRLPADRFPVVYHKWTPIILRGVCRYIFISVAFFIQRIVSAVHSSVRGVLMISRNLLQYAKRMEWTTINEEETFIDEIIGYSLAFLGFWFQLANYFNLPFPLNIILFPASFVERFLMWFVAMK
jgi:hypothetical protein